MSAQSVVSSRLAAGLARARAVLRAGRELADADRVRGAEARRRLSELGILSPEGVELALSGYLETSATETELEALVGSVESAPRVHVLLSANVCTGALRALALACASAPRVCVRPSRRDPVVAELLVSALGEDPAFNAGGASVDLVLRLEPRRGDAVHLYGRDETLRTVVESLPSGVLVLAHGTGFGVATLDRDAEVSESAEALARDVVVFDQAGCLSPRVVLVDGDALRGDAFARALHRTLADLGAAVPRAALEIDTEAAVTSYVRTLQTVGAAWVGDAHVVGLDPSPRALVLPPPARAVHVVLASAESAADLLSEHQRFITVVGASGDGPLTQAVHAFVPHARRVPLGRMQRPPFDGPVDRRPSSL